MVAVMNGVERSSKFPTIHVVPPLSHHTHTALIIHGRSSSGPEFASQLLNMKLTPSPTSSNLRSTTPDPKLSTNLRQRFPTWRFVFPSSRIIKCSAFEEPRAAWFDAYSLDDPMERQDLQKAGIEESLTHLADVLHREVSLLHGESRKVLLGGWSMGGAMALNLFLRCTSVLKQPQPPLICGVWVSGTWMPFADSILGAGEQPIKDSKDKNQWTTSCLQRLDAALQNRSKSRYTVHAMDCIRDTPFLICHGLDDKAIHPKLGRQVVEVLERVGVSSVTWKEYTGASHEGHGFKEPVQLDDIASFMERSNCPDE